MFKRFWWVLLVALIVFPGLGLLSALVVTYIQPKIYESTAVIQVRLATGNPGSGIYTAMEAITSRKVLEEVSDQLDLPMRWGVAKEDAIFKLKSNIQTEPVRGTDLIEIRVRQASSADSQAIAETTVNTYTEATRKILSEQLDESLVELREEIRMQEEIVKEKRKVLTRLIRNEDLLYRPPASKIPPFNNPDLEILDFDRARTEFESAQNTLDKLKIERISIEMQGRLVNQTVIIHSKPVLAHTPVSPNIPLNLALGTVAGFFLGLILAFPIMAGLHRKFPPK